MASDHHGRIHIRKVGWLACLMAAAFCRPVGAQINWPYIPNNVQRPIGNSYGEYQNYGGAPYLHPGVDMLNDPYTPVYAVKSGWVKAVLTTAAELHWRVAIGDSAGPVPCNGWLYAHLDQPTIAVMPGDFVDEGDYLGSLVFWPIANFSHCHFVKIHDTGYPWPADWDFIANPMDELQTITDTTPPYFIPVNDEGDLAFAVNNSHTYFAPGTPVSGPVDIIARVQDEVASTTWSVTPDQISYEIHNDTLSTGEIVSFAFTGHLFWEDNVNVIYQDDATYKSYGDYNTRAFYFIVTNTDGDSVVEASDADRAWQTQNFNNGAWWVRVTARDHGGNVTKDSMQVVTANYFTVTGTMGLCDGAPDSSGTLIAAPDLPGSPLTTTDARGRFALNGAILGATHLRVSRPGYATLDTTFSVPSAPVVSELGLNYKLGDVNHDQVYDVLDVVGLIGVVFRGSTQPLVPYWSGDMDFNRVYDILDVVQLIGVAFRGNPDPGPPPCEP